jgi:hypothetical protein
MAELSGNSCSVVTIFPMGVDCVTVPASSTYANDGSMSLIITGGTSPYTILWSNGAQNTTSLTGVTAGFYSATVIDYYGDYTATTLCSVFAPSPTPTPTTTPTPTPTPVPSAPSQICLQNYDGSSQFDFGFAGYNGYYPYFTGTSFNTVFNSTNGYWYLSGWTGTGSMINSTLSYSPLGSWVNVGSTVVGQNWVMISGSCSTAPLYATLTQTNESCLGNCNGTITVNASGGVGPYTYQVNYGPSQSSNFFSGLCSGTGVITITDSNGDTLNKSYTISAGSSSTLYTVVLNQTTTNGLISSTSATKTMNWTANVNPALPVGGSLTFNLVLTHIQYNNKLTSPTQNASFSSGFTINGVGGATATLTAASSVTTGTNGVAGCPNSAQDYSAFTRTYQVTIPYGGSLSGTVTSIITNPFPEEPACPVYGSTTDSLSVNTVSVSGLSCGTANPSATSIGLTNTTNIT